MKKAISKLLLAAVFMLCYISAFAHDFEVDGVYYKILNSTNKTLEVTYQGSSYSSYSNEYAGEVVVPSTVAYNGATYTVVSIGSSAFRDCITLTSVTIPEGVTAINSYAFSGCVCLTSVTIPASVTSIGQYAFNGCTGLSEVTVPGVTSIDNYAFATCSGVKSIAIGESITSIGAYAFSGCTGLTSITIPESTTSIGNKAFENCTAMTTVNFNAKDCSMGSSDHPVFTNCTHISTINIGENVEVIPAYAFKGCSGLTSIAIPEGVTSIYTYAFYGCSGMKEVTIPKSVASIGTYAFYGCSSLTSVVIPDGVTTIRDYTFCNCYSLATVEIPESVTSIGVRAFEDCDGMTTITLPGSVTSIGNYAFYHCSKLAEISIPNSVTSVGDYLFLDCSKLENVVIPESLSSISAYTFQGCKALASVNIPGSITTIGKGAFYSSGLTSVSIPNSVTSIGQYAFYDCDSLSQISIPESVISIDSYAFSNCGALGSVTIPNSVIYLGTYAFENSDGLKQIIIPESLSLIRDYTFYDCDGLTEITIPNSVTSIGEYAFEDCSNLVSLTLGSNLSSIGKYAFRYCADLNVIHATGSIPPSLYDSNVFYNVNKAIPVYVPTGCVEAYKKASYWSSFSTILEEENTEPLPDGAPLYVDNVYYLVKSSVDRTLCVTYKGDSYSSYSGEYYGEIVIPDSVTFHGVTYAVTEIGTEAFRGCTGLITLTIGKNIKSIGNYAFYNCTKLRKLTLQDGKATLSLGDNGGQGLFSNYPIDTLYIGRNLSYQYAPFKNIEELKSVTIGDNVTRIGNSIFYNCTALSSVAMGKNVTAIGNSTFYNCDGLKEITIPNSVTTIGEYAFYDCDGLTDITIPDSVTSIGNYVFYDCNSLSSVTIGSSVTSIGNYAFFYCEALKSVTIGSSVTSIGNSVFYNCSNLAEIHVKATTPPTLANGDVFYNVNKSIPVYVPAGCASAYRNATYWKAFTNIIALSDDVFVSGGIYYKITSEEEGTVAVTFCGGTYNEYTNEYTGTVAIPESVTHNDVVYRVTSIANEAFRNCTTLTKVDIPNSITSIGDYAFATCTGLTTVTIGNGVAAIGNRAFENCHALKSISIPQGVTSIGNYAFSTCIGLTEITIPGSVTSIGIGALAGCSGVNSIEVEDGNTMYDSRDNCNAIVETAINKLIAGCKNSVIPGSVTAIGDYAFSGVTGLRTILIPQDVTSIGVSAFSGCSGLEEIRVEAVVPPTIVATTFGGVNKSTPVYVPAGCAEVYRNVEYWQEFANIKEVAIIVNGIHYKITSAENKTMAITSRGDGNDKYAGVVEIPTSVIYNDVTYKVTSVGEKAFMDCTDLTSVVIPNSITSISQSAFFGCTGLTEMTIPNSVTSIGIGALAGCSGVNSIVVEEGNTMYDSRDNCNAIVEIATNTLIAGCKNSVIPGSVTAIGEGAFYGCGGMTSITIPQGVTSIGVSAFSACSGLKEIRVEAVVPPTIVATSFDGVNKSIPVYIPEGCASVYRNAVGWREFTNIIGLRQGVFTTNNIYYKITSEENKTVEVTFKGSTYDEHAGEYTGKVVIPASVLYEGITYGVTAIGKETFRGCHAMTSITIPGSVTSIGEGALFECAGLTSIVVGEGNEVYDSRDNCNAIIETATNKLIAGCKNSVIPGGVTAIGEGAFYGCSGMTSITIPQGVTSIGVSAFYGCSGLKEIRVEAVVPPTIDVTTFDGVNKSIPVYIPLGCAEVYRNAEGWREFINIIAPVSLAIVKTTPGEGEEVDSFSGIVVEFNKPVYIANEAGATVKDAMGETIATLSAVDASLLTTKVPLRTTAPIVTDGVYTVNIPAEMFATDGNEEYNANTVVNFTVKSPPLPVGTTIEVDGIYYKVTNSDNRTVEVTFKGSTYYEYTDEYTGEVEIPENVTFKGGKYSVTAIGQSAFKDCASLTSVVIPGSVTSIGAVAFEDCAALKGVTIGNGVTAIGDYAFYNCIELASVNIPEGVTTIGKSAFNGCSSLASVDIPNSVTSLGGAAFEGCTALYSVTIGNGVTAIGDYTFYKCTTLPSVTIPEKVATIGQSAFQACSSLREIISEAITPPTVKTNTFNQVDKSIPVYVPEWSVDNYRKASFWNQFTNIIGVANGVIVVNGVYYKKTSDEDKTVEVTFCGRSYDEYAGEYTGELEIPDSVTYQGVVYSVTAIGKSAFKGCTSLTSVVIPGSVTEIGGAAFEGCTALNSVTIGNAVTAIGDYAFYKCVALTSVSIPENVAMIGLSAFQACVGLVEIVSEAITPPAIESTTFSYVDKSIPLYVPGGCADAYSMADYWSEFTYIEEIGAESGISLAAESIKVRKENNEWQSQEVSLPISMQNTVPVVGMQCDIELPDGLTAVKNNGNYEVTLSSRANDYRVETILRQDGLLRVLIYPKSVSPIVIYDEELYIIKNSYIDKQESAQSAQEKNLEYPTAPKPISGRNGELFSITLMPNEHYSTNDNVVIRNAEAITRSYSIQEIADLVIACTVQGDATGDESDVSDIDNVESVTRIYAAGNKIVIESPQAQKAQIIMMDGLVLRKFLQPGHNEIPMQQGIYIVSVGSIAKKIVIR